MVVLANFSVFNIAKKLGWETFWDSVKFTWDSTFVDALGPRDPIEIKPKSDTDLSHGLVHCQLVSIGIHYISDVLLISKE